MGARVPGPVPVAGLLGLVAAAHRGRGQGVGVLAEAVAAGGSLTSGKWGHRPEATSIGEASKPLETVEFRADAFAQGSDHTSGSRENSREKKHM